MSTLEQLILELEQSSRARQIKVFDIFCGQMTKKEKQIEQSQNIKNLKR